MPHTSHGQPIYGTPVGPPYFGKRVQCGGYDVCAKCKLEMDMFHHPEKFTTNRDETQDAYPEVRP